MDKIKIIKTLGIINVGILGMLILKQNGLIPTDGQIINTIKGFIAIFTTILVIIT